MLERVLFAGGGTGGHIYMALALADELEKRHPCEFLFVGTGRGLEKKILAGRPFALSTIRIGGLKRVGRLRALRTLLQLPLSLAASARLIRRFSPRVLVGLGGYSSGPVLLAGALTGFPSIVIEPNAWPGFTNRRLARWTRAAAVAFPETERFFGSRARLTGIPVRPEFYGLGRPSPGGALRVLVFGGSLGSRPLNRLVCESLPHLPPGAVSLVHQTGREELERVRESYRQGGLEAEVLAYIDDMPARFGWADLIVSRAGALSIAEIMAAGRPAVLVPFPRAADDHQRKNARTLVRRGGALVLEEAGSSGEVLARLLLSLASDRLRLEEMGQRAREMARPDAASRIVDLMQEVAG